jgi:hypothetical protein
MNKKYPNFECLTVSGKGFLMSVFKIKKILSALTLIFIMCTFANAQQNFALVDDIATTGPMQSVSVNVLANDTIICTNPVLTVTSYPAGKGTATVSGDFIKFSPNQSCIDETVVITYQVTCNGVDKTANLTIIVTEYNRPINIIDANVSCYEDVPENITFGTPTNYTTPTSNYDIDVFTSPMVGDLNGDGKPEIVMLGVKTGGTARPNAYSIEIFNGQTGEHLRRHVFGNNGGYSQPGFEFHRSPSKIVLAKVDSSKTAAIFQTGSGGDINTYKPVFNAEGTAITSLDPFWTRVPNFKLPITTTAFSTPNPYITDLNGDGIPELIVYNKVYNAQTGALLMSWQGAATVPNSGTSDTISTTTGLVDVKYSSPTTSGNATNIRNAAMTGRRPGDGGRADRYVAVPAIWDIDGDGQQ